MSGRGNLSALERTAGEEQEGAGEDSRSPDTQELASRATGETREGEEPARYLSADEIFNMDDTVYKEVYVPEWKTMIRLKSIKGHERDSYLQSTSYIDKQGRSRTDIKGANARLVMLCAVNPDGSQMFNRHQVDRLQEKNAAAVSRLADEAGKMNGFGVTDDEDEKRQEALG